MGNQASIREVAILQELSAALKLYASEAQQSLFLAEQEITRTTEWLQERQRFWRREMERAAQELGQAKLSLQGCLSSGYYDSKTGQRYIPDCSRYEAKVQELGRRLNAVQAEFENVSKWARAIQQAIEEYRQRAHRYSSILSNDVQKAASTLNQNFSVLQSYTATGTGITVSQTTNVLQATSKWVELPEVQDVPIDRIDLSDSYVHSSEDFKKVSRLDMIEGLKKLEQVVKPAVQNGADADYFSQLDAQLGLDNKNGYKNIYDVFYGSSQNNSTIKLDKLGDTYKVNNGYHRLYVAKELGLKTIPARITVKVEPDSNS
ncbi:MAG: hypothetical protein FOGNACKC_03438 [Anaerolineae bacterium]|nr:hypothetical protein [Anaerolineae bacterium]